MSKTAAIPMDKEIQSFQFIFTGQQYFKFCFTNYFDAFHYVSNGKLNKNSLLA